MKKANFVYILLLPLILTGCAGMWKKDPENINNAHALWEYPDLSNTGCPDITGTYEGKAIHLIEIFQIEGVAQFSDPVYVIDYFALPDWVKIEQTSDQLRFTLHNKNATSVALRPLFSDHYQFGGRNSFGDIDTETSVYFVGGKGCSRNAIVIHDYETIPKGRSGMPGYETVRVTTYETIIKPMPDGNLQYLKIINSALVRSPLSESTIEKNLSRKEYVIRHH